jgi:uncharacterized protein
VIELAPHDEGTLLPVRAHAAARQNGVRGEQDGALKVCVTQAPERGKANRAIIEVLAKELRLRRSQIELVSGETNPQKRFLIRGVPPEELAARLAKVLSTPCDLG